MGWTLPVSRFKITTLPVRLFLRCRPVLNGCGLTLSASMYSNLILFFYEKSCFWSRRRSIFNIKITVLLPMAFSSFDRKRTVSSYWMLANSLTALLFMHFHSGIVTRYLPHDIPSPSDIPLRSPLFLFSSPRMSCFGREQAMLPMATSATMPF